MRELREVFWLSAIYNFHLTAVYIEGANNTLADAISRLHSPAHLLQFHSALVAADLPVPVDDAKLLAHMSPYSLRFLLSRYASPGIDSATRARGSPFSSANIRRVNEDNV